MNESFSGLVLLTLPMLGLFGVWLALRHSHFARSNLVGIWVCMLALLATIGAVSSGHHGECTRLASGLIASSSVWLVGPFLVFTSGGRCHPLSSLFCCALLWWLSVRACTELMSAAGQIWEM
jgi:hypothetical protein